MEKDYRLTARARGRMSRTSGMSSSVLSGSAYENRLPLSRAFLFAVPTPLVWTPLTSDIGVSDSTGPLRMEMPGMTEPFVSGGMTADESSALILRADTDE